MLKIEFWGILFTIINLLILYLFMKKFLFKPVHNIMAKRKEEIDTSYRNAEEANKQALELKTKYEDMLKGIDAERDRILSESKQEASKEYDTIIDNANQKADKLLQEARLNAEKELKEKEVESQQQMARLVAEAAYKIASAKDSAENDRQLYDSFLQKETAVSMEKGTDEV